jgi:tripartite-type tricarboxylate transporter receptor subunit TctC
LIVGATAAPIRAGKLAPLEGISPIVTTCLRDASLGRSRVGPAPAHPRETKDTKPSQAGGHGEETRMIDRRRLSLGIVAAGFSAIASPLAAQQRVVRLIVPAAPGGAIDVIGRLYGQRLSELLGQAWVVENKSGASNTIGAAEVARAAPDGSTFLTNADIQIMARHVMRSVSYDPIADFTPISRFATSPMLLVGNSRETPATLAELIDALKAQPDRFSFANSALGSMGHLATESFKRRIDARTLIVNYRGTAPAINDVLGGQVALMVAPLGSALPHVNAGTLRAFAVMSPQRTTLLPNVPTIDEAGLPGLDFMLWYGLWGPKGLAVETVGRVNAAVQAASREPALVERLVALGAEPVTEDAASFARFIEEEVQRAARIAQEAGIRPE